LGLNTTGTMTNLSQATPPVAAMVHHCCLQLREKLTRLDGLEGLVVGCGKGDEVLFIERELHCRRVVGIDVGENFSGIARASGRVFMADAESLPFAADSFDFVAAFHSLEHIHDARRAVNEIWRVLRPEGLFYVGVPNRLRLVGYIGSFDATTWQKIYWNMKAWRAQLSGKFRNELGAHAGYDRHELLDLLSQRFSGLELLTADFLRYKYRGRIPKPLLNALLAPRVFDYSVPSHYAIGRKSREKVDRRR
jgi:SAM-dependent methyltransferase